MSEPADDARTALDLARKLQEEVTRLADQVKALNKRVGDLEEGISGREIIS